VLQSTKFLCGTELLNPLFGFASFHAPFLLLLFFTSRALLLAAYGATKKQKLAQNQSIGLANGRRATCGG
jgi:hypothetical protein